MRQPYFQNMFTQRRRLLWVDNDAVGRRRVVEDRELDEDVVCWVTVETGSESTLVEVMTTETD
jgi:hypothetical protein